MSLCVVATRAASPLTTFHVVLDDLVTENNGNIVQILDRLDVKELLIHLGPLLMEESGMTTEQWSVELAVGAGLASLEARRLEDTKAEITGILRDYPSLFCKLDLVVKENASMVILHLKSVHIELNGKD